MLINTFLDTEDFVHLYYPEDEPPANAAAQGCGAGARMASKYANRPPSPAPRYDQVTSYEMCERERARAPPPPEPPPHRVRAADLYPRVRTHYDEPGVEVPFVPICGEFVQWVGRTADGGAIAASNYRVHVQGRRRGGPGVSVPLRLLDAVDVKDLIHLLVFCKDGRTLKCSFNTSERCAEWCRRLTSALAPMGSLQETFAAAYAAWAREQPPASIHRALMRASQTPQRHWFAPEIERLGFTTKGAWRVTAVNTDYRLCSSYPPLLVVPATICDEDLDSVARFRAMRRVPAVVWRHRGNGAVIARSSQPEVGWLGWRSGEDERLLAAFVSACTSDRGQQLPHTVKQIKLLIVDARSYTSAVTNRARGGGCECQQYYPAADIQFMSLPNIHHVRKSFQQLRQLAAEPPDQTNWHSNLERTLWLQYISGLGRAVALVARAVMAGRPVLVHCSDGWDRTPQIVATAQLILDPYYRTCEGFRVLIEREWLDFGHKFADRCGHPFGPEDPNERSPIFLQWLDYVHQIMRQYPCSFEFSEAYLIKLVTHAHSCMFGTFLCNSPRERAEQRIPESTAQVWRLLDQPAYRNHLYTPPNGEQVLWPEYNVRALRFWSELMVGWGRTEADDDVCDVDVAPEPVLPGPSHAPHHQPHAGLMTKTRSCDNLLAEGEKRTAQRRCSDPNIAPDALKLASILPAAESASSLERPDCRSAVVVVAGAGGVTDSYVDGMMARAAHSTAPDDLFETAELSAVFEERRTATDQVDGTQLNLFDNTSDVGNLTRDIASNSSSLERELAAPINTGPMTPADPLTPEEPSVFVEDTYGDVGNPSEMNRETGRTRHISITWRSVSESSHQTDSSAGFDLTDVSPKLRSECNQDTNSSTSVSNGAVDNHNSTDDDLTNHNVSPPTLVTTLANRNTTPEANLNVVANGTNVNHGIDDISAQLLAAELGGPSSSSVSSESETEGSTNDGAEDVEGGRILRRGSRSTGRLRSAPRGSQQTLCPGSPSMALKPHCASCCYCCRRASATSGVETSGESLAGSEQCCCGPGGVGVSGGGGEGGRVTTCVCGGGMREPARDPLDGLPPAHSAEQIRLHQIIMHQTMLVEELRGQLRTMQARRVISPSPATFPAARALTPAAVSPTQGRNGSNGNGNGSGSASASASGSGSGSEVEVGEEARGVVWLPDSAAPRCQYCRNHFWLARRRHHCRKCGGIFCGSCSEVGPPGELPSMRVCLLCRTHR